MKPVSLRFVEMAVLCMITVVCVFKSEVCVFKSEVCEFLIYLVDCVAYECCGLCVGALCCLFVC